MYLLCSYLCSARSCKTITIENNVIHGIAGKEVDTEAVIVQAGSGCRGGRSISPAKTGGSTNQHLLTMNFLILVIAVVVLSSANMWQFGTRTNA